jgi:methyl-accepting chemotaxis protein
LLESSNILKDESVGIKVEVSEALTQLQFQDRVSQIMTHVRQNIELLPRFLEGNMQQFEGDGALHPLDPDALLGELIKTYATDEERALHKNAYAQLT